jgi:DNA polymerase-3 subunit delta'
MLSNIIGQEKLKKFISYELAHDTLSHGYIIDGDKFMGKSFIASELAEEITVPSYITQVLPSEDRKLIQVDDIRNLKEDAYSASFRGAKKVYIIANADKMTVSAQNAFLKVLEEPPQDCIFILLTEDRQRLLETIRSRCTTLVLCKYSDKEIDTYLSSKGFSSDTESIRLCNGILNRWEYISNPQFETDIKELAFRVLLNIQDMHPARVFAITKHLKKIKDNINDVLDIFIIFYRDLYVYKLLEDENQIEFVSKLDHIKKLSKLYEESQLMKIIDHIQFTRLKYEYNSNFDMTTEMMLLRMRGVI